MKQVFDLLLRHRSIRKFRDVPIDQTLFLQIISAGQAAASSSFLQGVTVMRVTDCEKRAAFKDITGGQAYVEAAPEFLVFCADLSRPMRCCTLFLLPLVVVLGVAERGEEGRNPDAWPSLMA